MYKGVFGYHRPEKARRAEFGLERGAAAAPCHGEGQCSARNLSSSLFHFSPWVLVFSGCSTLGFHEY